FVANGSRRAVLQNFGAKDFAREMHQLQNEEQSVRFDRGQVLAVADYDFGNTNLARAAQRLVQNRICFFATLLRLEKVRFVEKLGIDLLQFDEVRNVDGMRGFDPDLLEVLLLHNNVAAALVFESLNDLLGWNLF